MDKVNAFTNHTSSLVVSLQLDVDQDHIQCVHNMLNERLQSQNTIKIFLTKL